MIKNKNRFITLSLLLLSLFTFACRPESQQLVEAPAGHPNPQSPLNPINPDPTQPSTESSEILEESRASESRLNPEKPAGFSKSKINSNLDFLKIDSSLVGKLFDHKSLLDSLSSRLLESSDNKDSLQSAPSEVLPNEPSDDFQFTFDASTVLSGSHQIVSKNSSALSLPYVIHSTENLEKQISPLSDDKKLTLTEETVSFYSVLGKFVHFLAQSNDHQLIQKLVQIFHITPEVAHRLGLNTQGSLDINLSIQTSNFIKNNLDINSDINIDAGKMLAHLLIHYKKDLTSTLVARLNQSWNQFLQKENLLKTDSRLVIDFSDQETQPKLNSQNHLALPNHQNLSNRILSIQENRKNNLLTLLNTPSLKDDNYLDESDLTDDQLVLAQNNSIESSDLNEELDDFTMIDSKPSPHENLKTLLTYKNANTSDHSKINFEINKKINENVYQAVLNMNDLSYAVANLHLPSINDDKHNRLQRRVQKISSDLEKDGWSKNNTILVGATGSKNQDEDATCIVSYNSQLNTIIVAFHGSRNGSKNFIWNNGIGDWGANYESTPTKNGPSTSKDQELLSLNEDGIGIEYIPEYVTLHKGFGKNFKSVQKSINDTLVGIFKTIPSGQLKNTLVLMTGHSNGAAKALIAVAAIKSFLSNFDEFKDIHIGGILFSGPRVFYGQLSRDWFYSQVNKKDVLRINVHGDPVPLTPFKISGYLSIGVLLLDKIDDVRERGESFFKKTIGSMCSRSYWAAYHYSSSFRNSSLEFTPNLVLPFNELPLALQNARDHLESKQESFLSDSLMDRNY